jgi:hypothetical protein
MTRTTEQRIGDITLVLAAVSAIFFVAVAWNALDISDDSMKTFWSYLGLSVGQPLYPAFAAACLFNWSDKPRRPRIAIALVILLVLFGLVAAAGGILGQSGAAGRTRQATWVLVAAYSLMATAGVALVRGFVPAQLKGLISDAPDDNEPA